MISFNSLMPIRSVMPDEEQPRLSLDGLLGREARQAEKAKKKTNARMGLLSLASFMGRRDNEDNEEAVVSSRGNSAAEERP
ncbi:MAG: hypothetical protein AAF998_15960 [Bacteroidota bacterium]